MATAPRKWQVDPLTYNSVIANQGGTPTPEFMQQWNLLLQLVRQVTSVSGVEIETTAPIGGGGALTALTPITHDNSGATPGVYGDATNVAQVTVDATGHVTAVTEVAISSGPGTSWTQVASHNFTATPQATFDADVTGYSDVLLVWSAVALAASGFRAARVSTDGGGTFHATLGDYVSTSAGGLITNAASVTFHATAASGSRTGQMLLSAINVNDTAPKTFIGGDSASQFVANGLPITDVRFLSTAAGNITAGTVYVLAK